MSLQEPSDRERRMYYCGLPSGPKLVARSSITPWFQPHEWPKNKRLDVATGHKIQQLWNDPQGSLRKLIIGNLSGIDWTAIDILRVGYEDAYQDDDRLSQCPVTMLISITENSTSFRQAEATIIACKDILIRFGLNDVEVEMKESIVSTTASTPGPATSDPLRDWALVELAQDSFTTRLSELRNKIPVTQDLSSLVSKIPASPTEMACRLRFSASHELAIGPIIIPGSEQGPPGLVILKHGRTTGFTVGRANGVHSVLRHAFEIAEEVVSSEWCIVGLGNAFSDKGDSGAVVFDLEGRVGGMITAGLRKQDNADGFDVTYATPMQWLLDDIKRHGYDVELPN
ncbi:hypothetical protein FOC4_g10003970 [Fusarium odoratissimum]|uniref:Peptidase S1 domain-containing protein n=1 Tax=Fusarium oxysporum f. sp. cubense (strain race 4) TaxID=2502994 RepID=N1S6E0_FUSC4|nr:hypothetical protein FOC4_g10003970 [Fusarium odoratissimum]